MKILFISRDLIAGNLAYLLKKEGHEVRLYIGEKARRQNFDYMVHKTKNWKKELSWVGKDGLIVFDDVGWGKDQDSLRKKGYSVIGGSAGGDRLEMEREFGMKIFAEQGLQTVPIKDFSNIEDAIIFVRQNKGKPWVIKRNDGQSKFISYVGIFDDGRDVESLLLNYLQNKYFSKEKITLHQKVEGVEIGIGRYFNGQDWVGPIEMNLEHVRFLAGDLGPATSEMGTLAWYDDKENVNKLFQDTLEKLKPHLKKIDFRGDFAINCIVNENGAYVLEATCRFGSPIVHLQTEIQESPWAEFLLAVAQGKTYDLKWKKGYGIVVCVTVPPFPFLKKLKESVFYGINIYFKNLVESDLKHIHFEEASLRHGTKDEFGLARYYISDNRGYILYTTAIAPTVEEAQEKVYTLTEKVIIPKMMYRNDIGTRFIKEQKKKLQDWGYLQ